MTKITFMKMRAALVPVFMLLVVSGLSAAAQPLYNSELIFPPEHWHNHSSSIVELPNRDLLVC